jgi:hypothetical protein
MTRQGNQVLTFTLGEETYGVDILRVQEIAAGRRSRASRRRRLMCLAYRIARLDRADRGPAHALQPAARGVHAAHGHHRFVGRRRRAAATLAWSSTAFRRHRRAGRRRESGAELAQASTEFIAGLAAVSGRMVMLLDIDRLIGGECGCDFIARRG